MQTVKSMPRGLSERLSENRKLLEEVFHKDSTVRYREIIPFPSCRFLLLYLDGMASSELVDGSIVRPLMRMRELSGGKNLLREVREQVLFSGEVEEKPLPELLGGVLYGDSILLAEGCDYGLLINSKGFRTRGVSEPENESVEQGPREGFTEVALASVALIRRKISSTDFCAELQSIGRRTQTKVYLCYLESLASGELVKEVKRRLAKIDIDGILDSNYLNELIRDKKYSLFKTVGSTERPDVVAANLLEGRVAVVVDGTPVVLTVPFLFAENFQSDEDYYINFWVSSVARLLRYLCFFLSITVPALYLAFITQHQRLMPTFLLLFSASSRSGVPISSFTEALALILILEILREAGARMPQNAGHTLSIVGGLVVGQAAVEARLVSSSMLIVVSLGAIAGLMIPKMRASVFYLRLFLLFMAKRMGIPGVLFGLSLIFILLASTSSFGVSYFTSLNQPNLQGVKDSVLRLPWGTMKTRPAFNQNRVRQKRHESENKRKAGLKK